MTSFESKNFLIGAISGILPLSIVVPIDYIKVQIQVLAEGHRHYRSHPFTITRDVFVSKGPKEFYEGLAGAVCRQLVLATIRLGLYKTLYERMKAKNESKTVPVSTQMLLAASCGAIGGFLASPFDLAIVRLQSDRLLPLSQSRNYTGTFNSLFRIFKEEGFFGL